MNDIMKLGLLFITVNNSSTIYFSITFFVEFTQRQTNSLTLTQMVPLTASSHTYVDILPSIYVLIIWYIMKLYKIASLKEKKKNCYVIDMEIQIYSFRKEWYLPQLIYFNGLSINSPFSSSKKIHPFLFFQKT